MKDSPEQAPEFAAFIGVDWGDKKHDIRIKEDGVDALEHWVVEHTLVALRTTPATPSSRSMSCSSIATG